MNKLEKELFDKVELLESEMKKLMIEALEVETDNEYNEMMAMVREKQARKELLINQFRQEESNKIDANKKKLGY